MKDIKKHIFNNFASLTLWSSLTIAMVRLFEVFFVAYYQGAFVEHLLNNLLGICFDIVYFTLASMALFIPFYLISKKSDETTLLVFRVLYSLMALVAMLLVGYFSQTGIPLDRVFFMYSIGEIMEIISSSQTTAWWMYLCIAVPPVGLFLISRRKLKISKTTVFVAVLVILACVVARIVCYDSSVNNKGYYEQSNKICYFLQSLGRGGNRSYDEKIPVEEIDEFRSYFPENQFVSYDYPFLCTDRQEDVIGQYFALGDKKPNIVMVVVEGLGRENSGRHSKFISSTPFLDSLAEHSLYWLNCLSTSQRTAGVLPALLGSLPFGREGFMAYRLNAPSFNSLPKILNDNGYSFAFYYGGRAEFDNMNDFISLNGGSQGFAEKHSDTDQRTEWGLNDKYLFSEAVKAIDFESDKPRFDLYMTLTSHMPWDYPDKSHYIDTYKKMKSPEGKKLNYDIPSTAAYLYVDEALRQLITDYAQKPGFENTIFIITGDHNYYLNTYVLERYHVPLLIWSPLLKESKFFPAVVSHRDVIPTLLNMLSERYGIDMRDEEAWINGPLDTSSVFRSASFSPQMDGSRNIVNMLYRDYYVDNGNVYKIVYADNKLKLEDAKDKKDKVLTLFELYKAMDKYVCDNDMLIESDNDTNSSWFDLAEYHSSDTLSATGQYPLDIIDIRLCKNYKALKVTFDMDFIFSEIDALNGVSLGLRSFITKKDGKWVYDGCNEIKSFDERVKHYEFNEIFKRNNYNYSDGDSLKIFLWNWGNYDFKIIGVNSSVKVIY